MPFAWIALSALVSVPLAVYYEYDLALRTHQELGLAYGSRWALRDDVLAVMVPYALNLGAMVWLVNADGTTRWGAFWATAIGAARIVAPFALIYSASVTVPTGEHYVDWQTVRYLIWFLDAEMFILGLLAWLAFRHFVDRRDAAPSFAPVHAGA